MTSGLAILIAALGGEGGGVLTSWIVKAAQKSNFPVQATSIPGVAQRTGATTYYIEIWPETWDELNNVQPVFALSPSPGEVDVFASSELLETGRQIQAGYVTPDRTALIASNHRVFSTAEKMKMGDGRANSKKLIEAVGARSKSHILFDMDELAQNTGAHISAVLLGAIAGCGVIPIQIEDFRHGIRVEGKAIEANIAGFEEGLRIARGAAILQKKTSIDNYAHIRGVDLLFKRAINDFPMQSHDNLRHAIKRLVDFQDRAYAELLLDRLETFSGSDEKVQTLLSKHLPVRMSFEDVIRVAQVKTRPQRLSRIRAETGASDGDAVTITEFLKPGIAELCDVLPEPLARWVLSWTKGSKKIEAWHMGMELNSTSITGFMKLWLLAKMRIWRRFTWRYRREQENIEAWLNLIKEAEAYSTSLAIEIIECARLIKGYGNTHKRGTQNYSIIERELIKPALANPTGDKHVAENIAVAREAALADPEGKALSKVLTSAVSESKVSLHAAE